MIRNDSEMRQLNAVCCISLASYTDARNLRLSKSTRIDQSLNDAMCAIQSGLITPADVSVSTWGLTRSCRAARCAESADRLHRCSLLWTSILASRRNVCSAGSLSAVCHSRSLLNWRLVVLSVRSCGFGRHLSLSLSGCSGCSLCLSCCCPLALRNRGRLGFFGSFGRAAPPLGCRSRQFCRLCRYCCRPLSIKCLLICLPGSTCVQKSSENCLVMCRSVCHRIVASLRCKQRH